jgi:lipoprotein-anchoring transpeptidase ErfK/SrfK
MANVRSVSVLAAVIALVAVLAGCSAEAGAPVATTTTVATPQPTSTAVAAAPATTTAAPTSAPAAAAPTPVAAPIPAPVEQVNPVSSVCAATPVGVKEIYVSIAQQHLWACTGTVLLTDTPVTTGASALTNVNDATPLGTSRIRSKVRNTVLAGHDVNGSWNDPVQYWMPFSGGDGFHDAPWQTFPLGSQLYKTQGSHGCVHVPLAVIAVLFNWAPVGTLVNIQN